MNRRLRTFLLQILLIGGMCSAYGQIESPFDKGSIAIGQGNAFAANMGHYAILYNQAGIAEQKRMSFSVDAAQLYNNSGLFHVHAAAVLPTKTMGTFGLRMQNYGLDGYTAQNFSFTYARLLLKNFTMAATFNVHQFQIDNYGNTFVPNFEIGVRSKLSEQIYLGVHLANPLPLKISENTEFPTVISAGILYQVSDLVGINLDFEKNIKERESIKIGINYAIHPRFQLRVGMNANPGSFHFGFSLVLEKLNLHLGNAFHPILGHSSGLGVMYSI